MIFTAASGPITAISAVGHAKLRSARMCFEAITSYAPPYAFLVITVSFGTVASANEWSGLDRLVDVEDSSETRGLVSDKPNGRGVEPSKARDDVPRVRFRGFK